MTNLVERFERFRRSHLAPNPEREAELTAFTRQLSGEGELGEYTDEDWLTLSRKLGLNDDQYAALMEGTASWIVDEPESITEQSAADWPDETPREAGATVKTRSNPARATRGISPNQARRGTPEFDELMADLVDGYVDARYPGLTGYAYRAEMLDPEKGTEVMEDILGDIVELRWPEDTHPEFRLKGEDNWRSIEDTEDFPQPSSDPVDDEEGEEEEEEEDDSGECFEDCKCPDPCDHELCEDCNDGRVCCCPCTVSG